MTIVKIMMVKMMTIIKMIMIVMVMMRSRIMEMVTACGDDEDSGE